MPLGAVAHSVERSGSGMTVSDAWPNLPTFTCFQ